MTVLPSLQGSPLLTLSVLRITSLELFDSFAPRERRAWVWTSRGLFGETKIASIAFRSLMASFLGTSFMTTYYLERGLSQAQVFILQTVLSAVSVATGALFGYMADRIGQRTVMIAGSLVMTAQSIGFVLCEEFWQFVIALIGTGLYLAMLSGTSNAMMTISVKLLNSDAEARMAYQRYLAQGRRYENMAYAASTL